MPELDAEHRDQIAEALTEAVSYVAWETQTSAESGSELADYLLTSPALVRLLDEARRKAWAEGYEAGLHDGSSVFNCDRTPNPHRGGDDG